MHKWTGVGLDCSVPHLDKGWSGSGQHLLETPLKRQEPFQSRLSLVWRGPEAAGMRTGAWQPVCGQPWDVCCADSKPASVPWLPPDHAKWPMWSQPKCSFNSPILKKAFEELAKGFRNNEDYHELMSSLKRKAKEIFTWERRHYDKKIKLSQIENTQWNWLVIT